MDAFGLVLKAFGSAPEDVGRAVAAGLLLLFRLLPLTFLAPFLSFRQAPGSLWLVTTGALTAALLPTAIAATTHVPLDLLLVPLMLRELALGAVYGLCLALSLLGIAWGGELIDRLRGDPLSALPDTRGLGQLYFWLAAAVFFTVGGHRVAIESVAEGLIAYPLGQLAGFAHVGDVVLGSARLVGDALGVALTLSLPVAFVLFVADLALGLGLRASTIASAASLPGARFLLALAVVLLGLPVLLGRMPEALASSLREAAELLGAP